MNAAVRMRLHLVPALALTVALVGSLIPAQASPRPGRIERISVALDGTEGDDSSSGITAITPDGRYVAFESHASTLTPGVTNSPAIDVYVLDRVARTLERVSVSSEGGQGNHHSRWPSISADGRYVAFDSRASNLVPGDTNGCIDVFVHDRATRTTRRVSVSSEGAQGNRGSAGPTLSRDGRVVYFRSASSNLVPGDTNAAPDLFVHDLETGVTEPLTFEASDAPSVEPPPDCFPDFLEPRRRGGLSADGQVVAFQTHLPLVPEDTNGSEDIYVRDREAGTVERISVASDGTQGSSGPFGQLRSWWPQITPDGRHVVFVSDMPNLVPGDSRSFHDVYVHDRETGVTERVSVSSTGVGGDGWVGTGSPTEDSWWPSISDDGRLVTFHSSSSHLVRGVTDGDQKVFVHDRATGSTRLVSVALQSEQRCGFCGEPAISGDGRLISFWSFGPLIPEDRNAKADTYLAHIGPALGPGEIRAAVDQRRVTISGWARFAGSPLAAATDPDDLPDAAGRLGLDLSGAGVVYRPEEADLMVRLNVTHLPGRLPHPAWVPEPGHRGGVPGVVYGLRMSVDGTAYEIRAMQRQGRTYMPPAPAFRLYRCEPLCLEVAALEGGLGTVGDEVRTAVPLANLGAGTGSVVTDVEAWTSLGDVTAAGPPVDAVSLGDAVIPLSTVEVGLAPAGTLEDEVDFEPATLSTDGRYSLTLPDAPPGTYEAWVRGCLGTECETGRVSVTVPSGP